MTTVRRPLRGTATRVRDRWWPGQLGPLSRSRLVLAAKAGVASALAWYAAHLIPGSDPYAYYGPLGAVVAMTLSIADSVRQSLRGLVAIGIGAALALVAQWTVPTMGLSVALLVSVGVLIGGWKALGQMGVWIPFSALFVLMIGGDDSGRYVASYAGLTLLGGVIATLVNIAVPPLPIASFGPLAIRIRTRLVTHFDDLSAWLVSESDGSSRADRQVLAPLLIELWDATDHTADARRVNPRARWHAGNAARQYQDAARLERFIYLAQEIGELVAQGMEAAPSKARLDAEARERVSQALARVSRCLYRADADLHAPREEVAAANRALRELIAIAPAHPAAQHHDWLLVSLVTLIRRCLLVLTVDAFTERGAETDAS